MRHSQRMNEPPLSVWIITRKEGTVISAHCLGCKAGLSETWSHVSSLLFYIEVWTKIDGKLACTQVKCTWLLPTYVSEGPGHKFPVSWKAKGKFGWYNQKTLQDMSRCYNRPANLCYQPGNTFSLCQIVLLLFHPRLIWNTVCKTKWM